MTARRQSGVVKGPCPGCHTGTTHPSGGVCVTCAADLVRGRAAATADLQDPTRAWYRFSRTPHWNPNYYLGVTGSEGHLESEIAEHFTALVFAIAPEAIAPERYSTLDPLRYRDGGPLLIRPKELNQGDHVRECVRLTTAQAAAINALDQLICRVLLEVAAHAVQEGRNLLTQLALGKLTMDAFNDATEHETAHIQRKLHAVRTAQLATARQAARQAARPARRRRSP